MEAQGVLTSLISMEGYPGKRVITVAVSLQMLLSKPK